LIGVPEDRYKNLRRVLDEVFIRVSQGKGEKRHATSEPFEKQILCTATRAAGLGFPFGQVLKKIDEAQRFQCEEPKEAKRELLDCIAYLAAAILILEEQWK